MNAKVNTCIISRKQTMGSFYINVRYREEGGIFPVMQDSSGLRGNVQIKLWMKVFTAVLHCWAYVCIFFPFNQTVKIKTSQPVTSDRLLVWLLKGDNSSLHWLSAWGPQEETPGLKATTQGGWKRVGVVSLPQSSISVILQVERWLSGTFTHWATNSHIFCIKLCSDPH